MEQASATSRQRHRLVGLDICPGKATRGQRILDTEPLAHEPDDRTQVLQAHLLVPVLPQIARLDELTRVTTWTPVWRSLITGVHCLLWWS